MTAPAHFSPAHLRALRRLQFLGSSKLRRWKRASRLKDRVSLRSEIVADLWAWRLAEFSWHLDTYRITDAGRALIAECDAPLLRAA